MPRTLPDRLTTWQLADRADCGSPDSPDGYGLTPAPDPLPTPSPGAEFLRSVEDATREAVRWELDAGEFDPDAFDAYEIADGAVPIYTHDMWAAFIDLAAYNEDPTDYGADGSDMGRAAAVCLYMIAERLASTLVAEWAEEWADEDENGEDAHDHVHEWGAFERSRLTGTGHWPCSVPGCGVVTLDNPDHDGDTWRGADGFYGSCPCGAFTGPHPDEAAAVDALDDECEGGA